MPGAQGAPLGPNREKKTSLSETGRKTTALRAMQIIDVILRQLGRRRHNCRALWIA